MNHINYHKKIHLGPKYDVIVAGAGPAGVCAAVAAAREGATVALIERYGVLGGNLTSGYVGPILGMVAKGSMRDELLECLGVPDNDMIGESGLAHDFERAKRVLAEFVDHENIDVYLQTTVVDVVMSEERLVGVIIATKEGQRFLRSETTVDATGDGDVAFLAGARYEKGRNDGLMQPVTLEFTIDQVNEAVAIACIGDVDKVELNGKTFLEFCKECSEIGLLPKNLAAVRLHRTTKPGERQVNTTQVNGIDATKVEHLFRAELELRRQIDLLLEFFRKHLPGYENCTFKASGTTIGTRETRRIMGEYLITAEELAEGKKFEDVVVHNAEFVVDIHNPEGPGQAEAHIQYVKPYDLPYRCLVPETVDGLLLAGRCISGTHRAHASYRVMSICMAMGQAAGIAAALSAAERTIPRKIDIKQLQETMTAKGIDLFS